MRHRDMEEEDDCEVATDRRRSVRAEFILIATAAPGDAAGSYSLAQATDLPNNSAGAATDLPSCSLSATDALLLLTMLC